MSNALMWPFDQTQSGDAGSQGANALTGIGQGIQQETQMTPQQLAQYQQSFSTGQGLQSMETQALAQGPSGAYQAQGPLQAANYQDILAQAQNPTAGWQSTLQPQLQQAQNQINEYYNARGLDNSGIAIGAMGTAGVDLAIQNAQNEMAYQQQSLQNAGTLASNISTLNQNNTQNLQGLYGTQQAQGLSSTGMQQQGYQAGAEYMAYPQQAQLGAYYGQQAGAQAAQNALPGQLLSAGGQLGAAYLMGA